MKNDHYSCSGGWRDECDRNFWFDYFKFKAVGGSSNPYPDCPCSSAPGFDNYCHHAPRTPGCPMTFPSGYCDPNGDGSYDDADWGRGWYEFNEYCR